MDHRSAWMIAISLVATRGDDQPPPPSPTRWEGLIGAYGLDGRTALVLESGGRLALKVERDGTIPTDEITPGVAFRTEAGADVRFTRTGGDSGRATEVDIGGIARTRRKIDGDDGTTFRIKPTRPIAELRPIALAAKPPAEAGDFDRPNLVDLTRLDPTFRLDIRYATSNNFAGTPFYMTPRAFLQRPAAEALVRVHQRLKAKGYGLLIHDAYRPWHVTRMFWDATPEADHAFVADPARGSRHNRGCAVDLTLFDLATGRAIEMPGGYDEFSPRSNPDYPGGTSRQRWHRDLLRRAMEAEGFTVNEVEWWHFDFKDWARYPILNATFDDLDRAR